jgi:hypothetical protein
MEVICINGTFSADFLLYYSKYGVKTPKEGKLYAIRDIIKHTNGQTGIRLEQIVNPKIPDNHAILGKIETEPTFNIKRFAKLNGDEITKEEITEIIGVVAV